MYYQQELIITHTQTTHAHTHIHTYIHTYQTTHTDAFILNIVRTYSTPYVFSIEAHQDKHTCTHMHTRAQAREHTCISNITHLYIYIEDHIYLWNTICIANRSSSSHAHKRTHAYTHTHAYINTYQISHTYTYTLNIIYISMYIEYHMWYIIYF